MEFVIIYKRVPEMRIFAFVLFAFLISVMSAWSVGVDNPDAKNPQPVRLKQLEPFTILNRGIFSEFLSNQTNVNTSNLTASGQMLDSIKLRPAKDSFRITIPRTRRSGPFGGDVTNREVAERVSIDRPFFALTQAERGILTKIMERRLAKELKRLFK